MTNAELQILDRPRFMQLIEEIILNPTTTFVLSGIASASVTTQIGELVLENVQITQTITLAGKRVPLLFFFFFFGWFFLQLW